MNSHINADLEAQRLKRMITHPQFLKHMGQRFACFGVIFLIWVYINGGVLPMFLRQRIPMLKIGNDANILTYFSGTGEDGVNIRWAHGVNSLDKLERALYSSDIHMVEADVMLRGQGTPNQELVPVMAQFPDTDSTVTFDEWLDKVIQASSKGIKLDFQAIDALEVTLQKMIDKRDKLMVPVWLHADVLQGPWGKEPKVDVVRFVKIVRKMFPESTLSLGWTTGYHTDLSQSGYTWDMALDMHQIMYKLEIKQPLVISARAAYITNSVPQLKWLTDNTRASVYVWQAPKDLEDSYHENLMYMCYKFAPQNVFFDLTNPQLTTFLVENRHMAGEKVDPKVKIRDTQIFRPEAWVKMGFYMEPNSILASTEAVVLSSRAVYLVTKAKYKPSGNLKLSGRVQFLNRKQIEPEEGRTGFSIYLRSTRYNDFENINGIKCYIGLDGHIIVESFDLKGTKIRESQRTTPGSVNCFRFSVVDEGSEVMFKVAVQHDCFTLESAKPDDRIPAVLKVPIPGDVEGRQGEHPFIIKLEDSRRSAVLDELTVKYTS